MLQESGHCRFDAAEEETITQCHVVVDQELFARVRKGEASSKRLDPSRRGDLDGHS